MVMATALVAGFLVPTLAVIRDSLEVSSDQNRRNLLANYAVSVLESQCAKRMMNWTSSTVIGDFTADGHANIRYQAVASDDPVQGGIVGKLMHIQVTVFDDTDGDGVADADERQVHFRTKIAQLESYQSE
jgi:hypothetical protein